MGGVNHKKYDFGSWQELIKIVDWKQLSEYDELILANDSVFGPFYPLNDYFEKIEKDKEWDVCGINRGFKYGIWHISSYFIVFKKKAFDTDIFKRFFDLVEQEKSVKDVICKYEVPFMKQFYDRGYVVKCVLEKDMDIYSQWIDAVSFGSPFIKVKGLSGHNTSLKDIVLLIKNNRHYPIKLIYLQIGKRILKNIRQSIIRFHIGRNKTNIKLFGIDIIKEKVEENENMDIQSCPIKLINK